jgi:hypothetical protein
MDRVTATEGRSIAAAACSRKAGEGVGPSSQNPALLIKPNGR